MNRKTSPDFESKNLARLRLLNSPRLEMAGGLGPRLCGGNDLGPLWIALWCSQKKKKKKKEKEDVLLMAGSVVKVVVNFGETVASTLTSCQSVGLCFMGVLKAQKGREKESRTYGQAETGRERRR